MKRACVSVDLDGLHHYARIHGLGEGALDARARALHLTLALPRLLALFQTLGLRATLFVVGQDVHGEGAEVLQRAVQAGHELASHSHTHPYGLARAGPAQLDEELGQAEEALRGVSGVRPEGFRAPGYTLSAPLLQALVRRGYRYDASVFPAVPYYVAKALVLLGMRLLGRASASALDSPAVLWAPRQPYTPSAERPYRRGGARLLELPMAVTPVFRVPFFGTLLTSFPAWAVRAAYQAVAGDEFLSLELHAVDALDEADGIPRALVRAQRDVGVPRAQKERRLREVLGWLARDFSPCTLGEAAQALQPGEGGRA
ncbi:MAG: polysaccharide deacetylase family protein [Myxococcaceae bacterium]